MINQMPISSLELGLIIIFVVTLFSLFKSLISPLRSIPGPLLARFTRAWLFREAYRSTFPFTNIELHRRYGRIIRIAPNEYSIDDPAVAKIIYGSGKGYIKSPWYRASKNLANVSPGLFDERDPHIHSSWRRKVAAAYAMTSLVQSEPFVDECTSLFQKRLSGFAKDGTLFDMSHWLQCYAFDVIGMITFGDRFGFLDNGEDIEGVMISIDDFLKYAVRVGIFSEWHPILFWYKVLQKSTSGLAHIRKFALKRLDARWAKPSIESAKFDVDAPADFITKFLRIRAADPSKISKDEIATICGTNVGAGSDTTSISLSSVVFHLCKYPETLSRLRSEIDGMSEQGLISNPVTYQEAQQMPYLQAVIKEALRLHPATGLILGRVVPEGGAELAGQFFPGGTVVGINTWVAHRNEEIFGAEVDEFRPERWLEDPEVVKRREAYFLTFGQGSRTCIGKNISLMEMSKVIPQLVRTFDFLPDGGEPSWRVENVWFVKPKDFKLRVKLRNTND